MNERRKWKKIQSLNENIRISMELCAKLLSNATYIRKKIFCRHFQLCKLQLGI